MRKSSKLVYGFGVNDSKTSVYIFEKVDGKDKVVWKCPFYAKWKGILERSYCEKHKIKFPTYIGCSVSDEWLTFSNFKSWMEAQDWQGNHLDKDLLFTGNKIYSKETCLFIPPVINGFIIDQSSKRGDTPIGVSFHKDTGKFQAEVRNPITRKSEYLGIYNNPNDAHEAWKTRKFELALILASSINNKLIAEALIKRYSF